MIHFPCWINDKQVKVFVDTGAQQSIMSKKFAEEAIKLIIERLRPKLYVFGDSHTQSFESHNVGNNKQFMIGLSEEDIEISQVKGKKMEDIHNQLLETGVDYIPFKSSSKAYNINLTNLLTNSINISSSDFGIFLSCLINRTF